MTEKYGIGSNGDNLVFILSAPRSGSTLLQRIIARHPKVHTTAEPWLLLPLIYTLREQGIQAEYDANLAYIAVSDFLDTIPEGISIYKEEIRRTATKLYSSACEAAGKSIFLDKTPRYYFIIPELIELFPQAKFVCLFRHPLAILNSILATRVKAHWLLLGKYRDDLLTAPRKLLAARKILGDRCYSLRYEDMVSQGAKQFSHLFDFLHLEFDSEYLEYGSEPSPVGKLGDQHTINQYTHPVTYRSERWLSSFTDAHEQDYARAYVNELGEKVFTQLGYSYQQVLAFTANFQGQSVTDGLDWQSLMSPNRHTRQRLFYAELALLEHRRIIRKLRSLIYPKKRT